MIFALEKFTYVRQIFVARAMQYIQCYNYLTIGQRDGMQYILI